MICSDLPPWNANAINDTALLINVGYTNHKVNVFTNCSYCNIIEYNYEMYILSNLTKSKAYKICLAQCLWGSDINIRGTLNIYIAFIYSEISN